MLSSSRFRLSTFQIYNNENKCLFFNLSLTVHRSWFCNKLMIQTRISISAYISPLLPPNEKWIFSFLNNVSFPFWAIRKISSASFLRSIVLWHRAARWLAQSSHCQRVPGSIPSCVEFACSPRVSVGTPGTPASSHRPKTCMSGWLVTLNWPSEWVWVRMVVCDWRPVQGVPCLSPNDSPPTLN